MGDFDADSTIGIWVGSDARLVEEFDEYFQQRPGTYSRSREVKHAMAAYLELVQKLDDEGIEIGGRRDLQLKVNSAVTAWLRGDD